jgi:hypothetical protein
MNGGRTIVYVSIKVSTPVTSIIECDLAEGRHSGSRHADLHFPRAFFQLLSHKHRGKSALLKPWVTSDILVPHILSLSAFRARYESSNFDKERVALRSKL